MLESLFTSSRTLFVFIDESGNFDFGEKGTNHYVLAGTFTFDPIKIQSAMQFLRYELMQAGHDISEFHASQDLQGIRDRVFAAFEALDDLGAAVIHGKKRQFASQGRSFASVHAHFGIHLVEMIATRVGIQNFDRLVLVFDRALTRKHQAEFSQLIKPVLKRLTRPFQLYFQSMKVDMNGQIADYVAWSKFVALERGEMRPWESLSKSLKPTAQEILGG